MQITPSISILEDELHFTFIRSSGPGGQNINKVATAVQLRYNIRDSASISPGIKERLIKLAGTQATGDGELIITARRFRSQEKNREDALFRLGVMIEKAFHEPNTRHATRPTLSSHIKRLETKKKRAVIKKRRQTIDE